MNRYNIPITLTLKGPILTASTGALAYRLQKSFFRNENDQLTLPKSHVKGKLRMALSELASHFREPVDVDELFGVESQEGSYAPLKGRLVFSDFVCKTSSPQPAVRTRIALDSTTYTADTNKLWDAEEPFPSGMDVCFEGAIEFSASDEKEAREIAKWIITGFRWIPNMGAEKGVGFGRLHTVETGSPTPIAVSPIDIRLSDKSEACHLRIKPLEPLSFGTVQKRRTNYIAVADFISGGVIKGAIAAGLNESHGVLPAHEPLSEANASRYPGFEQLVTYFESIVVSHALPAYTDEPRPSKIPLSAVRVDDGLFDVALTDEAYPMIGDRAPAYAADWKSAREYEGYARPREIFVTRTAIDETSRKALTGQLYAISYVCSDDDQGRPIEWVSDVDFSNIEDAEIRSRVIDQFGKASLHFLRTLGKRSGKVQPRVLPGKSCPALSAADQAKGGLAIITLQSDTLMLNPHLVYGLGPNQSLQDLYAQYWKAISTVEGESCMGLVDFFAHQSFRGGYLYRRYLGEGGRDSQGAKYTPYYLTNAGSVFKLEVTDEERANERLAQWTATGLAVPEWAQNQYGRQGRSLWQTCPFVPENGYGQVAVNLNWHWHRAP